jgi:hypothetical protein
MPQQWTVEHTDASGLADICEYEHYGDAKDVADQKWEEYKDQTGLAVKVYHQPNPGAPRTLVYTAGSTTTQL